MANTEIDSLSLDIKITGLESADVKNLTNLSKAVSVLTNSLKNADFSKLNDIKVPKGLKNIQIVTQNFKSSVESVGKTKDSGLKEEIKDLEVSSYAFDETAQLLDDASLKIENADEKLKDSTRGYTKELKKAQKELENTGKSTDKAHKKTSKFGKILKRFKTIAFIKAVRAILNAIVQTVQAGIQNLAKFDSAFNETMSKIKTSTTTVANSIALVVRPLIEAVEPFLTQASQTIAEIGNKVSEITASMKGLSSYTKISSKYMDDYANSAKKAQLFSFDTFNTLSGDDSNAMFETEDVNKENVENAQNIAEIYSLLNETLNNAMQFIGIIAKEVGKLLKILAPSLAKILKIVNDIIEVLNPLLEDIFEALNPLIDLIFNGLLPPLLDLLDAILKPVLEIVKELSPLIKVICDLIVNILSPVIEYIADIINLLLPAIRFIADLIANSININLKGSSSVLEMIGNILSILLGRFKLMFEFATKIKDAFMDLIHGDFKAFGDGLLDALKFGLRGIAVMFASLVDAVLNGLIKSINNIIANKYVKKIVKAVGGDWEGITWRSDLASKVPSFANGGVVGELWQMNEYGNPEMLYNANGNNTAVITQQQLAMAFEQAIYNTNLIETIQKAGVVMIDGRSIAQSTNFKNEINRTNPNLNIR